MATATPANILIVSMLATSMPVYGAYHAWKFDGLRCMLPQRKNRIRTSMLWLMTLSGIFFSAWSITYAIVRYRLGFAILPAPMGAMPVPLQLMSKRDLDQIFLCDTYVVIAFTFYDAVNLEEALYWLFLVRSVHQTREGRLKRIERWASSKVFSIYLALAIVSAVGHVGSAFFVEADELQRTIRIFCAEGVSTVLNVLMSIVLAWYLPPFIKTVTQRGGSKDVVQKLVFFEGMNMIRLLARAVFAGGTLALGIDGTTESKSLIFNPFWNDIIFMALCLGFWLSMIISIILYLPVDYYRIDKIGGAKVAQRRSSAPKSARQGPQVLLDQEPEGNIPSRLMAKHSLEHKALVALLRERGSILEHEKVPEDGLAQDLEDTTAVWPRETRLGSLGPTLNEDPEAGGIISTTTSEADLSRMTTALEDTMSLASPAKSMMSPSSHHLPRTLSRPSQQADGIYLAPLPDTITQFAGPFGGVPGEQIPREMIIRIEQEVEVNRDEGHVEQVSSPRVFNRDQQAEDVARVLSR